MESQLRIQLARTADIKQKSPPEAPTRKVFGVTTNDVSEPITTPTLSEGKIYL